MPKKRCKFYDAPCTGVKCSSTCKAAAKRDAEYFGGHRTEAVGYTMRECWICRKVRVKPYHVHHVFKKENGDEPLVGLCSGCHRLVTDLGRRVFLDNEQAIEDLITLARFAKGLPDARTIVKFEYTKGGKS